MICITHLIYHTNITGSKRASKNVTLSVMIPASVYPRRVGEKEEKMTTEEAQQCFTNSAQDDQKTDNSQRLTIIKFLSDNLFLMLQHGPSQDIVRKKFENIIIEATTISVDLELNNVLRNDGWNGRTFLSSTATPFDPNSLFLSLLNLHLRSMNIGNVRKKSSFDTRTTRRASITSNSRKSHDSYDACNEEPFVEQNISEKDFYFEQVKSFCPSILLTHLRARPPGEMLSVSSSSFQGACLLADISGKRC